MVKRIISLILVILHLFTFGPIRDAFAFSASSASYKLSAGTLTQAAEEILRAYTKLLLHYDGVDASTTFTDVIGKTVTANGNAQIDTTQSKFGGASALFDGAGDYLSIPDSADWNFGTGNFTIDFWVRFNDLTGAQGLVGQWASNSNEWRIFKGASGRIQVVFLLADVHKHQDRF